MVSERLALVAMLAFFGLSACNTVEGVGRDIAAGGRAVEEVADETRKVIQPQAPAPIYGY